MSNLKNFSISMGDADNDELYTPPILVKPIIKYIPKGKRIWCPFDTENSEFVLMLKEAGFDVAFSHIWNGQDFFQYEPELNYDYIISNPPFSKKLEVLKRLYQLGKPFAVILGLPILNYEEIGNFFFEMNSDVELLMFDKKVSYNGKQASFNTSYFCRGFLPEKIIFEHLENNNTGKFFVGSRMLRKKEKTLFD